MSIFSGPSKRSPTILPPMCSWATCGWRRTSLPKRKKPISRRSIRTPNSTDALGGVLNVDLIQKQPDKAIAAAKAQLAKYPKNAGFHIMLGQLLMEQKKDLAGAEAEFKQASDLDKKNSDALVKLGAGAERTRRHGSGAADVFSMGPRSIPRRSLSTCWRVASTRAGRIGNTPGSSTRRCWRFSRKIQWPPTIWRT